MTHIVISFGKLLISLTLYIEGVLTNLVALLFQLFSLVTCVKLLVCVYFYQFEIRAKHLWKDL